MTNTNKEILLIEVNNLLSATCSTSKNIEQAELLFLEYLRDNKNDIEIWFKLAILELRPPLMDVDRSIFYLREIWNYSNNIKAVVYIAIVQDIYLGGIEKDILNILEINIKNIKNDKLLLAMINYAVGLYYKNNNSSNIINAIPYFLQAIDIIPYFVHSYYNLGQIYRAKNNNLSKNYYLKAVQNVRNILKDIDKKSYDKLSISFFEEETILGSFTTQPKYDYLVSLTKS